MSYRSLKRVLGEKNLERKCMILFVLALAVLLGGGFWYVAYRSQDLVIGVTNSKGREHARTYLYDIHWRSFEVDDTGRKVRDELAQDLVSAEFRKQLLSIDFPAGARLSPFVRPDVDLHVTGTEAELIRELKRRHFDQLAKHRTDLQKAQDPSDPLSVVEKQQKPDREFEPVFAARVTERGKGSYEYDYNYYQAVHWKSSCVDCHETMYGKHAFAASDIPMLADLPFFVVKVTMPYEETGNNIAGTRAILTMVAFITVVVSVLALWVIVRYVVVKPLNHLRDVSDAVSRGHIEQRAEIQTGDEFEELATSFNKMLRSLIDTQAEIRTINQDLDAKVDELAQVNMRLYDMNRMKSEFLAAMSHELRTPLNSVIGFSEMLQGIESLTEKQRRYVQNIQKSGRDLLVMINDILDLAKLEAGRMELRLTEFQIERIIQAQCDLVRSLTEEKNLDLIVQVADDLPPLYQDQGKIQQILTNLLSNAIKFTPEGGRITVCARMTPQGLIEMTITDTGVGIAEADREIIFEKFRQGAMVLGRDALTREFSGTGLGLSIVKELCKRMGGEVTVESELGTGSTFRVLLPWMVLHAAKQTTPLQAKLDELTRPTRSDFDESESSAETAAS